MSNITPDLALYVNTDSTPYYWLDVKLPASSGYEIDSHGEIPEEDSPDGEIHVDVNLISNNGGSETIQIELGELPIDPNDGEVHIHLLDTQMQVTGGGIIKTEDATEQSKPIP